MVRIPEEVKECVVFIGVRIPQGIRFVGTGFLVGRSVPDTDRSYVYVVTARHVIDGLKRMTPANQFVEMRLNVKGGGSQLVAIPMDSWVVDPGDPYLDVAVCEFPLSLEPFDHKMISENMLATQEVMSVRDIGSGDEVFMVGLFSNHAGENRNIPILRSGSIASIPSENIPVTYHNDRIQIEAYLIEARSIGGLSGSPVFVRTDGLRGSNYDMTGLEFFLLGLVHGHWEIDLAPDEAIDEIGPGQDSVRAEAVNMGIAIVIPAHRIIHLLDLP